MSDDEAAAAMEVARTRGLRVAAHCRSAESVVMAVRHGITAIYHAKYADESALDALESARDACSSPPPPHHVPDLSQRRRRPWRWRTSRVDHRRRREDAPARIRVCPRRLRLSINRTRVCRDLELFVKVFGFSASDTLVEAYETRRRADGHPGELGVIEAGRSPTC